MILKKIKTRVYVCEPRMGFEKWKFMVKQCGMLYAKQKAFQITDCILCVLRSEIIQLVIWKWPETNIRPHYFRLFHNNQSINSTILRQF